MTPVCSRIKQTQTSDRIFARPEAKLIYIQADRKKLLKLFLLLIGKFIRLLSLVFGKSELSRLFLKINYSGCLSVLVGKLAFSVANSQVIPSFILVCITSGPVLGAEDVKRGQIHLSQYQCRALSEPLLIRTSSLIGCG